MQVYHFADIYLLFIMLYFAYMFLVISEIFNRIKAILRPIKGEAAFIFSLSMSLSAT